MASKSKSNELKISRLYDAPLQAVWDAWTDPEQVALLVGSARVYHHHAQQGSAGQAERGSTRCTGRMARIIQTPLYYHEVRER